MLAVFGITFPIFAMIALGYGLVAFRVFKPNAVEVFSYYVMNIALPALIFNAVTSGSVAEVLDAGFVTAYTLGGLATILVAYLWFSMTTGPVRRSVAVMGCSYPNSSFIGYPLILIVFPDIAALVLTMSMMVESLLITPITFLLLGIAASSRTGNPTARTRAATLNVLRRPVVLALIIGFTLSAFGVTPPQTLTRFTSILADSTAAIALLVIGGSVAGLPIRGNRSLASQIVVGKLVVHPLMTFLATLAVAALGFSLSGEMAVAVVLASALPMLSIYSVIAQEVDQASLASVAQLGATVCAFFTLPLLLAWLT